MRRMELLLYLALSANAVSVAFAMNHSSNLSNLTTSFESTRPSALKVTPNITASNITSITSQIPPTITSSSISPYYIHGGPCSAQNSSYYEFLQTHPKPLPANYTSPTCCGYCRISATTQVRVTYWPTPALEPNVTRVTSSGVVFVSPSVYIAFQGLQATNDCGQVGTIIDETTVAFEPLHISTWRQTTLRNGSITSEAHPFNFADLGGNCSTAPPRPPYASNDADDPWSSCHPQLSLPSYVRKIDHAWATCGHKKNFLKLYDPPHAIVSTDSVAAWTTETTQPPVQTTPTVSRQLTVLSANPGAVSTLAGVTPSHSSLSPSSPMVESSAVVLAKQSFTGVPSIQVPDSSNLDGDGLGPVLSAPDDDGSRRVILIDPNSQPTKTIFPSVETVSRPSITDSESQSDGPSIDYPTLPPQISGASAYNPFRNPLEWLGASRTFVRTFVLSQPSSDEAVATPSPEYFNIGGEIFSFEASAVVVSGATLTRGSPAIFIDGVSISLGSSALIVGDRTIPFQKFAPTQAPDYKILVGNTLRVSPSNVIISGYTFAPGSPAFTIGGIPISLGSSFLIVGDTTIDSNQHKTTSPREFLTLAGNTFVINPSNVVVAGLTLIPGSVVTIDGIPISLGTSDIVVDSTTRTITIHPPVTIPTERSISSTDVSGGFDVAQSVGIPTATGGVGIAVGDNISSSPSKSAIATSGGKYSPQKGAASQLTTYPIAMWTVILYVLVLWNRCIPSINS